MIIKIYEYIKKQQIASNQQIAREFSLDPATLQPMLDLWINRGNIICWTKQQACKNKCFNCYQHPLTYYQLK